MTKGVQYIMWYKTNCICWNFHSFRNTSYQIMDGADHEDISFRRMRNSGPNRCI